MEWDCDCDRGDLSLLCRSSRLRVREPWLVLLRTSGLASVSVSLTQAESLLFGSIGSFAFVSAYAWLFMASIRIIQAAIICTGRSTFGCSCSTVVCSVGLAIGMSAMLSIFTILDRGRIGLVDSRTGRVATAGCCGAGMTEVLRISAGAVMTDVYLVELGI